MYATIHTFIDSYINTIVTVKSVPFGRGTTANEYYYNTKNNPSSSLLYVQ